MRLRAKRFITVSVLLALGLGVTAWAEEAEAGGVQVRFGIDSPSSGPFPSDLFTVPDNTHNTGLRVSLPKPDCTVRVTECRHIDVINVLDGFNLQPRLSIPFTGLIDVNSVTSETIFLLNLGSTLIDGNSDGQVIGINQVVWDPDTNTLHVESDELLEQHTRYAVVVTNGIRDSHGHRIQAPSFKAFRRSLKRITDLQDYAQALDEAEEGVKKSKKGHQKIVALSVFTTQSTTAVLEKIRDDIKADTPAPADFLLGPGGTRTVFALSNVSGMALSLQTGTAPTFTSVPLDLQLAALRAIPGAVGTIAYGKYISPNYEASGQFIPAVGTLTGEPAVQGQNDIYFTLVLPAGTPPSNGWPVAIFGHSANTSKDSRLFLVAADLAQHGIATIGINAVGHGDGPLSTLQVTQKVGGTITFSSGGRGIDQNGDGTIGTNEGIRVFLPVGNSTASPQTFVGINNRDGLRQTVVDLMQLVREVEVGMDVDGDTAPDLDPTRIYYFGQSLGGIYGTIFLAVEPHVQVGVPNVPGGADIEVTRLSTVFRSSVAVALHVSIPALDNLPPTMITTTTPPTTIFNFNENLPLRDQPPVVNTVPGAIDIQQVLEWSEWMTQAGNPVAYAPHLRKAPLTNMSPKDVIIQFTKGDKTVPNPTATALLRAGNLADRATYYRNDVAFADPLRNPTGVQVPKDPHFFLLFNAISPLLSPAVADVGAGARQQIAEFFASDGENVIDPDGTGPLFEVPIAGPLPEELSFIP